MQASASEPIGLLAGWGRLPLVVARQVRQAGQPLVCVGLKYEASAELASLADRFYWAGVARFSRIIRCFQREGVHRLLLAGKVHKANYLHRPWRLLSLLPDWRTIRCFYRSRRQDNRDDALTWTVVEEFAREGIIVESALDLCPGLLISAGLLTRRPLNAREEADVKFGWELAKEMGRLDVGQSVAVKDRSVLAVEAAEGTDRCILRAGELCRSGSFVVVKVAKPNQDMRFDVPTVGPLTIESMRQARGRVLAVEAGKTILLDREETVAAADRAGISIIAVSP